MLTESEIAWLNDRKHKTYCRYCSNNKMCANPFASIYFCPLTGNTKDAAEFEGRVVEKLAKFFKNYVKSSVCADLENSTMCPGWPVCTKDVSKPHPPCDFSILKGVRLEVEEEMNNDV